MEIHRLRKELNELLDNIVDHSKRYSDERPIPSLEISFVLSKIHRMEEKLIVLRHLLEEKENSNKSFDKKAIKFPKMEDEDDIEIEEELKSESVINVEPVAEKVEDAPKKKTNIEQLPVNKLIDALTLNDRYLFANELFKKDMNAFNELVKSIDECSSIDEAKKLITNFENEWDDENEHVISFYHLIERRFM